LKAVELRPAFAEANFMIGEELLKRNNAENAATFYQRALAQDATKLAYYIRLGVSQFRNQDYPASRATLTQAIARFPDNANLYYLIGYAARAEGLYDEAIDYFNRSLKVQPGNADVLTNLGYIASQRGQFVEAEKFLRNAIALDKDNFPAHYDLGRLLIKLKRNEEAATILERGIKLNDKDPGVRYQLFTAYTRLKRKAEAERELAIFKNLDDSRRQRALTPLGTNAKGAETATEAEAPPPLSPTAAGDNLSKPPQN